jgi:hypothetical protein
MVANAHNLSYSGGGGRRIMVQSQPGPKWKVLYKNIIGQKEAGNMTQLREHLLNK